MASVAAPAREARAGAARSMGFNEWSGRSAQRRPLSRRRWTAGRPAHRRPARWREKQKMERIDLNAGADAAAAAAGAAAETRRLEGARWVAWAKGGVLCSIGSGARLRPRWALRAEKRASRRLWAASLWLNSFAAAAGRAEGASLVASPPARLLPPHWPANKLGRPASDKKQVANWLRKERRVCENSIYKCSSDKEAAVWRRAAINKPASDGLAGRPAPRRDRRAERPSRPDGGGAAARWGAPGAGKAPAAAAPAAPLGWPRASLRAARVGLREEEAAAAAAAWEWQSSGGWLLRARKVDQSRERLSCALDCDHSQWPPVPDCWRRLQAPPTRCGQMNCPRAKR